MNAVYARTIVEQSLTSNASIRMGRTCANVSPAIIANPRRDYAEACYFRTRLPTFLSSNARRWVLTVRTT
jgi:hypothetical protein